MLLLTFSVGLSVTAFCAQAARDDDDESLTLRRRSYTQVHMGVPVRLVGYVREDVDADRAFRAAFRRIAELDDIFSDYKPDSETNRLCRLAAGPPVHVSNELFHVLRQAQEIARLSDGAFDVTCGPLVRLWRTARRTAQLPDDAALREAKSRVGWQHVVVDEKRRTVQLTKPGMQLDFGGIAKGYAGDCALAVLRKHGITRALCEAGGDIVVGDAPPASEGWSLKLFDEEQLRSRFSRTQFPPLVCSAVSTSGDTEQFVEIAGKRYSHIVDPRTGLGLTNRVAATVRARRGLVADALSTAISVLGEETGPALAQRFRAQVFIRKVSS